MQKLNLFAAAKVLRSKIEKEISVYQGKIDELRELLGGGEEFQPVQTFHKAPKKKQVKRDTATIQKQAEEVAKIISAGGKDGVRAKAFKHIKINGSPKLFLKTYLPEFKWKTKGEKASTKYFAA